MSSNVGKKGYFEKGVAEAVNKAAIRGEAVAHLKKIQGKPLHNEEQNIAATIGADQIGKLTSGTALHKSIKNGFSQAEHYMAAANVKGIFKQAKLIRTHPDKNMSEHIVEMRRFEGKINLSNGTAATLLTVKKTAQHGHKIYSIELTELKKIPSDIEVGNPKSS